MVDRGHGPLLLWLYAVEVVDTVVLSTLPQDKEVAYEIE
jgi:hypothetical protein